MANYLSDLPWGPVQITKGRYKGRIGYYDDEEDSGVIVYLGHPVNGAKFVTIDPSYIAPVTTEALERRHNELFHSIWTDQSSGGKRENFFQELLHIKDVITDRTVDAWIKTSAEGRVVFISHANSDSQFALWLATDLKSYGVEPWLDEWEIRAGDSIPKGIAEGIQDCDFVVVVLSEHAVKSRWVEREWQEKYWEEVKDGHIRVVPALLRDCEIPTLLKSKKYADFRESYERGLMDILLAIGRDKPRNSPPLIDDGATGHG